MKQMIVFCALVFCLIASISCQSGEDLEKKYASFDVEKVLQSKRLVQNYVNCLTDKGACSPEGADLKKTLPKVLQTLCEKCTESQRDKIITVIRRLKKDYPEEWSTLMEKWDPNGEYSKKFQEKYGKSV